MSGGEPPPEEQQQGHAPDLPYSRWVWGSILGLLVVTGVSGGIVAGLVAWLEAGRAEPTVEQRAVIEQREWPRSPGPFDELREIRRELEAEQMQRLRSVGWINREQNLAHVPLDYAKRYIVENGLPEFGADAPPADPGAQPGSQTPSTERGDAP